ncbi:MAG: type secretion system contractile sheath small subunit [Pseudomonadota bacterium]|jgi:type VI secretion system protein ImpB
MSSQKFIARNRAPRVQIEYDVEVYGSEKRIQLPFVLGVLADLSGNAGQAPPVLAQRKFLEISAENFDDRLRGMKPGVALDVPDTLSGEGRLRVQVSFEALDDFSPAAIARNVPELRCLLDARTELANLIAYMDGKSGAEELIAKLIQDRPALERLAAPLEPAATIALTEGEPS